MSHVLPEVKQGVRGAMLFNESSLVNSSGVIWHPTEAKEQEKRTKTAEMAQQQVASFPFFSKIHLTQGYYDYGGIRVSDRVLCQTH